MKTIILVLITVSTFALDSMACSIHPYVSPLRATAQASRDLVEPIKDLELKAHGVESTIELANLKSNTSFSFDFVYMFLNPDHSITVHMIAENKAGRVKSCNIISENITKVQDINFPPLPAGCPTPKEWVIKSEDCTEAIDFLK